MQEKDQLVVKNSSAIFFLSNFSIKKTSKKFQYRKNEDSEKLELITAGFSDKRGFEK